MCYRLLSVVVLIAASIVRADNPAASTQPMIDTGIGVSLHGRRPFPDNDPWNTDVSAEPVDPNSDAIIAGIGANVRLHPDFGSVYGIPYVVVTAKQPKLRVQFQYAEESDIGPYPIPKDAPIEGGPQSDGDRHVIYIDRDNWKLYELFGAYPLPQPNWWKAGSGAIFDMNRASTQRPLGWTSCDAAGLPIFPGLVRYDEVDELKEIRHALRFTCQRSRHAFVNPARHSASSREDPNLPPMGMRVRLKSDFDIAAFSPRCQVILTALKKYGMFLADNGSNWYLSGAVDSHWDDDELHSLTRITGTNFEVVKMGQLVLK